MDKINWCCKCDVEGIYKGWYQGDEDKGEDLFVCPECGLEWIVPITADGDLLGDKQEFDRSILDLLSLPEIEEITDKYLMGEIQ